MGFLDFLKGNKSKEINRNVVPVLPAEIYKKGRLGLQDVIAPSALEVTPKNLSLGEKMARTFFVISYPRFLTTG